MDKCSDFHNFFFFLERSFFPVVQFIKVLPSDSLKFVCLSVLLFAWAINHVKIDPMSWILDVFLMQIIFGRTPKNCGTFYKATLKSVLNLCSAFTLEWLIRFPFLLLLLKRCRFHGDIVANKVVMRQFKIYLSVSMNICLGWKWNKNWFTVAKFVQLFEVDILSSYIKNCDHVLDIFCRVTSKSWMIARL